MSILKLCLIGIEAYVSISFMSFLSFHEIEIPTYFWLTLFRKLKNWVKITCYFIVICRARWDPKMVLLIEIRKCQLCPLRYWQKKYEFSARMKNVMFRGRKGEAKIIGVNSYLWTVTGRSHNFWRAMIIFSIYQQQFFTRFLETAGAFTDTNEIGPVNLGGL